MLEDFFEDINIGGVIIICGCLLFDFVDILIIVCWRVVGDNISFLGLFLGLISLGEGEGVLIFINFLE